MRRQHPLYPRSCLRLVYISKRPCQLSLFYIHESVTVGPSPAATVPTGIALSGLVRATSYAICLIFVASLMMAATRDSDSFNGVNVTVRCVDRSFDLPAEIRRCSFSNMAVDLTTLDQSNVHGRKLNAGMADRLLLEIRTSVIQRFNSMHNIGVFVRNGR